MSVFEFVLAVAFGCIAHRFHEEIRTRAMLVAFVDPPGPVT